MPELRHITSSALDELSREAFESAEVERAAIVVLQGARSWGAHERGAITLPDDGGTLVFPVSYDAREAPYTVDEQGLERTLISLSDEEGYLACVWARPCQGSSLVGVGIDLASPRDFDTSERGRRLTELMFTDAEHDLVNATFSSNLPYGYAVAFGAKEAAFKATAAPLRTWYRSHTEELSYDLRHFSLCSMPKLRAWHSSLRRHSTRRPSAIRRFGKGTGPPPPGWWPTQPAKKALWQDGLTATGAWHGASRARF